MKKFALLLTALSIGSIFSNTFAQEQNLGKTAVSKDYPLRFTLTQDHSFFSKTNINVASVTVLDFETDSPKGTVLAYSSGVGLVSTNETFLAQLKTQAALLGCNFVKLVNGRENVKKSVLARGDTIGEIESDFVCYIGLLRQASIGISYDPKHFKSGKQIVSGFDPRSTCEAGGLKVGDEVTAVDNVLVSDRKAILKLILNWQKDQNVSIRFRRGTQEKSIICKTF